MLRRLDAPRPQADPELQAGDASAALARRDPEAVGAEDIVATLGVAEAEAPVAAAGDAAVFSADAKSAPGSGLTAASAAGKLEVREEAAPETASATNTTAAPLEASLAPKSLVGGDAAAIPGEKGDSASGPPVTATGPPAAASESEPPATATEPPATATELPVTASERPVTVSEPPQTTSEPPITASEPPAAGGSEPPAVMPQEPVGNDAPPASGDGDGIDVDGGGGGDGDGDGTTGGWDWAKSSVDQSKTSHSERRDDDDDKTSADPAGTSDKELSGAEGNESGSLDTGSADTLDTGSADTEPGSREGEGTGAASDYWQRAGGGHDGGEASWDEFGAGKGGLNGDGAENPSATQQPVIGGESPTPRPWDVPAPVPQPWEGNVPAPIPPVAAPWGGIDNQEESDPWNRLAPQRPWEVPAAGEHNAQPAGDGDGGCELTCSGHGTCEREGVLGGVVCKCEDPWSGENCETDMCAAFRSCSECRAANASPPVGHELGCMWERAGECFGVPTSVNADFTCASDIGYYHVAALVAAIVALAAMVTCFTRRRANARTGRGGTYAPVPLAAGGGGSGGGGSGGGGNDDWDDWGEGNGNNGSGNLANDHDADEEDMRRAIELSVMEAAKAGGGGTPKVATLGRGAGGGGGGAGSGGGSRRRGGSGGGGRAGRAGSTGNGGNGNGMSLSRTSSGSSSTNEPPWNMNIDTASGRRSPSSMGAAGAAPRPVTPDSASLLGRGSSGGGGGNVNGGRAAADPRDVPQPPQGPPRRTASGELPPGVGGSMSSPPQSRIAAPGPDDFFAELGIEARPVFRGPRAVPAAPGSGGYRQSPPQQQRRFPAQGTSATAAAAARPTSGFAEVSASPTSQGWGDKDDLDDLLE